MDGIRFEWDEEKDSSNKTKQRVSFEEAKTVFFDDHARLIPDPDHSDKEERFILLGFSSHIRLLVVCHCYIKNDEVVRIISARKATKTEKKQYEGYRHER